MLVLRDNYYSSPLIMDEDEYLEKMFAKTSVKRAKKIFKEIIDRDKYVMPVPTILKVRGQTVDSAAHKVRKNLPHLGKEGKDAIKYYRETGGRDYFWDNLGERIYKPVRKNKDIILKVPKNEKLMKGLENYQKRVEDSMSPYRGRDTIRTVLEDADFFKKFNG